MSPLLPAMPRTLRTRLLLVIVPLVCLSNIVTGYFLVASGRATVLDEKREHLNGATRLLADHLARQGGYATLQKQLRPGESPLAGLNRQLAEFTERVAAAHPGLGAGYYHRDLDAILTYAPSAEHGRRVGQPIAATHPGRQVMASGQADVQSGAQVRGNIMNAMTPVVEGGKVVGYIWANELVDDIDRQLAGMRNTVLWISAISLLLSLALVYWIVTRLTREVSQIRHGLTEIEADLGKRIAPMAGETGEIVTAINKLAQSLFDSRQKEREQAAAAVRQREEMLQTAIEAIDEAFALYDPDDRLVNCNENYLRLFPEARQIMQPGMRYEEILREGCRLGLYPDSEGRIEAWVAERLEQHRSGTAAHEYQTRDGRWLHIVDRKTSTGHTVCFRVDITALKQATAAAENASQLLAELASRDGLTGLFNRRHMDQALDSAWADACLGKTPFGLLMIDIDHFKNFNDRYGHQRGDECLRQVAATLEACVAQSNAGSLGEAFVARYGGEEFVVAMPGAERHAWEKLAAAIVTEVRALAIEHGDNGAWNTVTTSVGGHWLDMTKGSPAALFRVADQRLFVAKQQGRNRMQLDDEVSPPGLPESTTPAGTSPEPVKGRLARHKKSNTEAEAIAEASRRDTLADPVAPATGDHDATAINPAERILATGL